MPRVHGTYALGDLPANNWRAALATWRKMKREGTWKLYYGEYLLNLQDDPTELMAAMAAELTSPKGESTP